MNVYLVLWDVPYDKFEVLSIHKTKAGAIEAAKQEALKLFKHNKQRSDENGLPWWKGLTADLRIDIMELQD